MNDVNKPKSFKKYEFSMNIRWSAHIWEEGGGRHCPRVSPNLKGSVSESVSHWVGQWVSDKVNYWAVLDS